MTQCLLHVMFCLRMRQVYNVFMCVVLPVTSIVNLTWATHHENGELWPILDYKSKGHLWMEVLTLILITVEIILRFIVWPSKLRFFFDPLNWFDVISTLATWSPLFVEGRHHGFIIYSMVFCTFRLCRVFRIWRAYNPYRALVMALSYSVKDFLLTSFIIAFLEVVFGFWIFAVEMNFDEHEVAIQDIPTGMYWALITLTSIGYGDILPQTSIGASVGSLCAWASILMTILPAGIFTRNYFLAMDHLETANRYKESERKEGIASYSPAMGDTDNHDIYHHVRGDSVIHLTQ